MELLLTILVILGSVGIILFVLVQNPKGGGLNSEFGSAVQLGGAKRATDILEKGTWGLAAGIAVICLFMSVGTASSSNASEGEQQGVQEHETNTDYTAAPENDGSQVETAPPTLDFDASQGATENP